MYRQVWETLHRYGLFERDDFVTPPQLEQMVEGSVAKNQVHFLRNFESIAYCNGYDANCYIADFIWAISMNRIRTATPPRANRQFIEQLKRVYGDNNLIFSNPLDRYYGAPPASTLIYPVAP